MVTVPQVFLPYMLVAKDKTLSQRFAENPQMLLGDGTRDPSETDTSHM